MLDKAGIALLALLAGAAGNASAAEYKLLGTIRGEVRNSAGISQMGAVVSLYNRYERLIQRTFTSADGKFDFPRLTPDQYSVRVSLSTYIPASRPNISVEAGMDSYLSIELATIFSSIELVYTAPSHRSSIMSDDWKWVLRSSGVTRPVLRVLPGLDLPRRQPAVQRSAFELKRGLMRVSAGNEGLSSALGAEPDLGTAFALATSVFGDSELRVLGNVGYASSVGTPVTAFRTTYTAAGAPDVELTVRQAAIRQQAGQGLFAGPGSLAQAPPLRTFSAKLSERKQLTEEVQIEYGALFEAVAFLNQMTVFSPFARLTLDAGAAGEVVLGYSSGAPALDLLTPESTAGSLQEDLTGLALFPRVSLRGGRAAIQRTQTYELGYRKVAGAWTYAAAAYVEQVRDAAFTMAAPAGTFRPSDLLPDISSNSSIFNLGTIKTEGMMISMGRNFGDDWNATAAYGLSGMLAADGVSAARGNAAEFRTGFEVLRRPWASLRLSGGFRETGTRVVAAYFWTPNGVLAPSHSWITQRTAPQAGLNIHVRQPLPEVGIIPGRFEMNAEVRNLLAQGYLPIPARNGESLYLIQFPRSLRGGFSFIF